MNQIFRRRDFLLFAATKAQIRARSGNPWAREAFRMWFCWLAECVFSLKALPAEIRDCSSLLQFAWREALRSHTREWARRWGYTWLPPYPEPRFSEAPLLRVGDERRHFADARHLMRFNTRMLAAAVKAVQPADLLFYRSPNSASWHAMAYLGRSSFERSKERYAVRHTGPGGDWPDEVRRPAVRHLLQLPEPRWRPVQGNPHFLGVYRRNLLSDGD